MSPKKVITQDTHKNKKKQKGAAPKFHDGEKNGCRFLGATSWQPTYVDVGVKSTGLIFFGSILKPFWNVEMSDINPK